MPHRQRHRGRHPDDHELFAPAALPALRRAVDELSWLRSRGYAEPAALKLVGDRHGLRERQRRAVARCACTDLEVATRASRRLASAELAGRPVVLDGFNCLITVEAALSGGVILRGRDGVHRDLASVHGSYRRVAETRASIAALGDVLAELGVREARWYLDRPISNSGTVAGLLRDEATRRGWDWQVELATSPDKEIIAATGSIGASSDGWILNQCAAWTDLPGEVIATRVPGAWIVDLAP